MQKSPFDCFLRACTKYGLILDTNMLVLYIVGTTDVSRIANTDVTKDYTVDLYKHTRKLVEISKFKAPIITPHIVSEVAHMLDLDANRIKKGGTVPISPWFACSMGVFQNAQEEYCPTHDIVSSRSTLQNELAHYGITDLSVTDIASNKNYAVLTDDSDLCSHIHQNGSLVISSGMLNAMFMTQRLHLGI